MSPLHLEGMPLETALLKTDARTSAEIKAERRRDESAFYLLFVLSFPFFLVVALARRLLPRAAVTGQMDEKAGKSIIAEASASTRSTIAIALTS